MRQPLSIPTRTFLLVALSSLLFRRHVPHLCLPPHLIDNHPIKKRTATNPFSPANQIRSISHPEVSFPHMVPAVTTTGLTRQFGDFTAVQDVNLNVAPGQFFGFLGPNGAGKSTTIKMLTGLLAPTSGSIQILGLDAIANPIEVKRQIGVVPEGLALFGRLTASEYLRFVGRMYGLDLATTTNRTTELLEFMGLANETKKLVTDYSHGMQKKLALAAAVIHGPKVLFLDEPFEGVDAIASGTLKTMLQGMITRGATIFLTSHVLEIVERLCTHIAIIDRGRLIADGSLEELRAGVQARSSSADTPTQTLTLEQIFLDIVGEQDGNRTDPNIPHPEQELSWLG
jgi:ABC-2 type transport system ATP-binding protein